MIAQHILEWAAEMIGCKTSEITPGTWQYCIAAQIPTDFLNQQEEEIESNDPEAARAMARYRME